MAGRRDWRRAAFLKPAQITCKRKITRLRKFCIARHLSLSAGQKQQSGRTGEGKGDHREAGEQHGFPAILRDGLKPISVMRRFCIQASIYALP